MSRGTYDGEPCAVKQGALHREVKILASLCAEQERSGVDRVVPVLYAAGSILVMPEGLDLFDVALDWWKSKIASTPLGPARAEQLVFAKNVMEAVSWMHAQQVVHLDLKLHNILLMPLGRLVLCDFGCAARLNALPDRGKWGTGGFRCPERVAGIPADLWSVGAVLDKMWYEILDSAPA